MKMPAQDNRHKYVAELPCALVLSCICTLILTGGCGPQSTGLLTEEPPDVKKCRAIAAENIELKKELAKSNKELEIFKEDYSKEIKEQQDKLRTCLQEKEQLKEKSRQNIRNQVKGVLETVLEDNKKLRESTGRLKAENTKLKAQIEQLQKQPQ
jgi:gas vesicle protein